MSVRVYEVLYHASAQQRRARTFRTRDANEARAFARAHRYSGRRCSIRVALAVPVATARRWGLA